MVCLMLRQYFEKHDAKALTQKVRGNFPIDMRPLGVDAADPKWFGNKFSQGQLRFPLHLEDPLQAFQNIKKQIDFIKISSEPLIRQRIVDFMVFKSGLGLVGMVDSIRDAFCKVTAMLSNVKGPSEEVNFAGQPLDDLSFYALTELGLYIGLVSYKGNIRASISTDSTCEPEPSKLAQEWPIAFERLREA